MEWSITKKGKMPFMKLLEAVYKAYTDVGASDVRYAIDYIEAYDKDVKHFATTHTETNDSLERLYMRPGCQKIRMEICLKSQTIGSNTYVKVDVENDVSKVGIRCHSYLLNDARQQKHFQQLMERLKCL